MGLKKPCLWIENVHLWNCLFREISYWSVVIRQSDVLKQRESTPSPTSSHGLVPYNQVTNWKHEKYRNKQWTMKWCKFPYVHVMSLVEKWDNTSLKKNCFVGSDARFSLRSEFFSTVDSLKNSFCYLLCSYRHWSQQKKILFDLFCCLHLSYLFQLRKSWGICIQIHLQEKIQLTTGASSWCND